MAGTRQLTGVCGLTELWKPVHGFFQHTVYRARRGAHGKALGHCGGAVRGTGREHCVTHTRLKVEVLDTMILSYLICGAKK